MQPPTPPSMRRSTTCPPIPRLAKGRVVLEPRKVSGGAAAGSPAFVRLQDVSRQLESLISSRSQGRPQQDLGPRPSRSAPPIRGSAGKPDPALRHQAYHRRISTMPVEVNPAEVNSPRARERSAPTPLSGKSRWSRSPADLRRSRREGSGGGGPHQRAPPVHFGYLRLFLVPVGHPVYHGDRSELSVGPSGPTRQQSAGYGTLIDGFSMAGGVILMNVIFFSALSWAVAFAPPSSLVLLLLSGLLSSGGGMLFLYLLAMGGTFLGSLWIGYRYAMAPYLLIDHPEQGAGAAVRESEAM